MMEEEIFSIVRESVAQLNEDLQSEALKDLTKKSPLFDELDSMAVLDFILGVEELLQKKYGRYIQIADEKSMDPQQTPFKTVETAVEHILRKVQSGEDPSR